MEVTNLLIVCLIKQTTDILHVQIEKLSPIVHSCPSREQKII